MTSSSEHAHANPLRQGGLYCTHHQVQGAQSDAPAPTPPTSIATPPPGTAAADAVASPTALSLTLLASSAERPFRDAKGELAPTVLMIGRLAEDGDTHVNLWRQLAQRVRECFPQFSYIDVILGGQTKSAWSLPLDAQSAETGTLAECLSRLGVTVEDELTLDDVDHGETESASEREWNSESERAGSDSECESEHSASSDYSRVSGIV